MLAKAVDQFADADSGKVNILTPPTSESTRGGFFFGHRTRMLIMVLSTACLSIIMANSLALNFTVICMVDDTNNLTTVSGQNATEPEPLFTEPEQSLLFSGIAIGTIIGTLPISYVSTHFGIRKSFTVYGLISALSTLGIPFSVNGGFWFVFIMRILQGFSVATSFPAMGSIISEWSTTKRSGIYIAFISIHLQLGSIITMPMAGELCESKYGWQALYYILGTATFILFSLFFIFYTDSASMHRNVSSKELTILQKNKPHLSKTPEELKQRPKVPYRAMFTDLPVISCVLCCFSSNFGYNVFIQYGPIYLNKVLGFEVTKTGFTAAMPALICIIVKFVAGPISDSLPFSGRWRIIIFATVSQVCMGACFVTLAFLPSGNQLIAQCFFTGAIVFSGLNAVGVIKSCQLISGRYSFVIMMIHGFSNACIVLILPFIVNFVAPDNTREQWARILIFIAVLVVGAIIFFDFTAEATPRPWAMSQSASTTILAQSQKDKNIVHPITVDDLILSMDKDKKEQV